MCGLCGLLDNSSQWGNAIHAELPERQWRLQQTKLLRRVLAPCHITLDNFYQSWVLSGATGNQIVVNNFDDLWQAVEMLLKQPLDPLDDNYLRKLTEHHG